MCQQFDSQILLALAIKIYYYIIGLVETRDCPENPDSLFADLRSYNVFRKRRDKNGGGIALVIKKSLKGFRQIDHEPSDLELIFVESFALNLVFCVFYGPPCSINQTLRRLFDHFRMLPQTTIHRMILMGDFNNPEVNWMIQKATSPRAQLLLDSCKEFGWTQLA